jgi:hypothetical protein
MAASSPGLWQKLKYLLVFLAPSLLLGAAVGLYPGYKFYHYAWFDAGFCTSCHVHDYATVGWAHSIHGEKTTCHDCHHQRLRDYIKEAIVMATKQPKFPKDLHHTPYVNKSLCSACHVSNAADRSTITGPMAFEDIQKIPKVDLSRLHSIHLKKQTDLTLLNSHALEDNERNLEDLHPTLALDQTHAENRPITCADCHGGPTNRGHNFSAVDATCVRCHADAHKSKVAQQYGCRSCHFQEFMIPISPKDSPKE